VTVALSLDDRVDAVEGVGTTGARQLRDELGITTVRGLVEHYPRRHQDLGELMDLASVVVGEPATLVGTVASWSRFSPPRRGRRKLQITEATVRTELGGTFQATFFNQPWRANALPPGSVAAFSGEVKRFRSQLKLSSPEVTKLGRGVRAVEGAAELEHRQLLPVYPATAKLPTWRLAQWVEAALAELPPFVDYLSEDVLDAHDLLDLDTATRAIHLPDDRPTFEAARKRLAFDELFTLQLGLQWRRTRLEASLAGLDNGPRDDGQAQRYLDGLPFAPTGAQQRAFDQIGTDLAAERPMHRLLQGDVGAGKTIVAVWSMLCAVDAGRQAALMVPTEVLAEQHFRTLLEQLAPLGVNVLDGVRVELLTGSTSQSERRRVLGELLTGQVDVVVGTHALLEPSVRFADLGVVVIDEQHRFGVSQRVALKDKAADTAAGRDTMPDVLVMTATPIPRSLALTVYGDLEVTVLDELPPGRQPIVTQLIGPADDPVRRPRLEQFVRDQAADGFQAYWVCPLVEASDKVPARAAIDEHERLSREVFPDLDVALVHGRLGSDDKDAAMQRFRSGESSVLVSTTVIEVGVDVPTATVMVIENAERFGISQLHQLRGRVGRGGGKSYCVLFGDAATDDGADRLEAVAATTDGFELAERDLEIRGEGQLFGERQSGLPDLKLARLLGDRDLITDTRGLAQDVIGRDPDLLDHPRLRAEVLRRYEGGLDDFDALRTG
jgi:ATP-dependent DNA helicase RecG